MNTYGTAQQNLIGSNGIQIFPVGSIQICHKCSRGTAIPNNLTSMRGWVEEEEEEEEEEFIRIQRIL